MRLGREACEARIRDVRRDEPVRYPTELTLLEAGTSDQTGWLGNPAVRISALRTLFGLYNPYYPRSGTSGRHSPSTTQMGGPVTGWYEIARTGGNPMTSFNLFENFGLS